MIFSLSDKAKLHVTKLRKRKVPNASIAGDDDTGTLGKDQGDRANNEEECSVGINVGEAEDDVCLTVSSNTIMSPCNY